ncbi:sulfite exporter TauE/SafE family protein [Pseudomonas typographi]|uniref:Probable membrane transporter protein n=1 Tax=Pseudomonas typographi TaxID=2715964 RepID=A0ABR7Z8D4_9PSED|nr:sulfite exporter TauE/SafE family protein [Pseudomonas typographi]MBD1601724.1 sulfite exporter TauE/SafE family protein [Pseudomonas typographi]
MAKADAGVTAVVLGALVGAVLALTGAGGGIFAVPLLILVLGLPVNQAAPVALLAVGFGAAVGALLGLRDGTVRYRAAGWVAAMGLLVAPAGLWLGQRLPHTPLAVGFAAVLLLSSLRQWRGGCRGPSPAVALMPCVLNPAVGRLRWTLPCARALAITGALAGALSGLLGVGGGFVIVPALRRCSDLPMASIVATSMAVIALVSAGAVGSALWWGVLRLDVGLPFAAGAAIGVLLGRRLLKRLAGPSLQKAFAVAGALAAAALLYATLGH